MIVRWTDRARRDLESIREFVARDSAHYADVVVHRLVIAVERLTEFPELGRRIPELGRAEVRELVQSPHRVAYRVTSDEIQVLAVHHGAQLLPDDLA